MAILEKIKQGNHIYLRIVESYRTPVGPRKRVIHNLGNISQYDDGKPNLFERLKQRHEQGEVFYEDKPVKAKTRLLLDEEDLYLNPKNLGYLFLEAVYETLGLHKLTSNIKSKTKLTFDLDGLTRLLVYGRILDPDSKSKTFRDQRNNYHHAIVDSDEVKHIFRALDYLSAHGEDIQKSMFKNSQSMIERETDLVYYDLTNYYFEILQNDPDIVDEKANTIDPGIRKRGVCKANKRQPLVQMGLFVDRKGIPISYQIHPGNTQDKSTLRPAMKKGLKTYGIKRLIIVADRGINTRANLESVLEDGHGYVVSKSIKGGLKDFRAWVTDEEGYAYLPGEKTFKVKSKTETRTVFVNGTSEEVKEKTVVYFSQKHYEQALKANRSFREYLESVEKNPDKLKDQEKNTVKFLKRTYIDKKTGEPVNVKINYTLDYAKIEKQMELLGYYAIVTSETDLPDREIIGIYHGLSQIEDAFRVIKSSFDGRPVHVRTKDHIDAHFLICFTALLILRIIQAKIKGSNLRQDKEKLWETGLSVDRIVKALNSYQSDKVGSKYKVTFPEGDLKTIMEAFGAYEVLTLPEQYDIIQLAKKIKKGIILQKKKGE
jgi:transposase